MKPLQHMRLFFELKDFLTHTPFELTYCTWCEDNLYRTKHTENTSYTLNDENSSLRFWVREREITENKKHFKREYALHIKHNEGALSNIEPHFVNHGLLAKAVFYFCAIRDNQRA